MHEFMLDASSNRRLCNRSIAKTYSSGGGMGDFDMDDSTMSYVKF